MIASAEDLAKVWIDQRWTNASSSVSLLPNEALPAILKEFWYSVVLAARHSTDPQHIADLVNLTREKHDIGVLKRNVSNHEGLAREHTFSSAGDSEEVASTQDGMVWSDLPYLRPVLFDAFLQSPPIMPTSQWLNLNAFAAQITAEGLRDLSYYAIWAMFDAFETIE